MSQQYTLFNMLSLNLKLIVTYKNKKLALPNLLLQLFNMFD